MGGDEIETPAGAPPHRGTWARWPRFLPPARVTWMALAVLASYGSAYLLGAPSGSLLLLPIVSVVADLAFQRIRFPHLRFPDSALVTGLFLVLLLPPTVSLVAASSVALAAIGLRHALRWRGRPLWNPAAAGVLLGAVVFGMAPAWWVSVGPFGEYLMLGLAGLVLWRSYGQLVVASAYFAVYAPFMVVDRLLFGTTLMPSVLFFSVLDPTLLFFGLFMVVEPRTSPRDPAGQALFAGIVALGSVFLSAILPSVGVLVALLLGNAVALGLRSASGTVTSLSPAGGPRAKRAKRRATGVAPRWGWDRRISATVGVLLVVGVVAAATAGPTATPSVLVNPTPSGGSGSGSGGGLTASCTSDNPSIPASTLQTLHRILGPSVILSYNANTGVTTFYDPVNHVTVTETDLYEDYGYAEFNGDDYAVSGCAA